MTDGSLPKIWTANGHSTGCVSIIESVFGLPANSPRALTRSVVTRPTPPNSRTIRRKGRFVKPASGESKYREGSGKSPYFRGGFETGRGGDGVSIEYECNECSRAWKSVHLRSGRF